MGSAKRWKNVKARKLLDERLGRYQWLKEYEDPPRGWIKALRYALGMSGSQLADRLNVTKQNISQLENGEIEGSITIKMMRRIAEALGCTFYYAFVPDTSLENTVKKQAERVAWRKLERTNQNMRLEMQDISDDRMRQAWNDLVIKLMDEMPGNLWDEDS